MATVQLSVTKEDGTSYSAQTNLDDALVDPLIETMGWLYLPVGIEESPEVLDEFGNQVSEPVFRDATPAENFQAGARYIFNYMINRWVRERQFRSRTSG